MKYLLIALILIIAIFIGLTEFMLPTYYEEQIEANFHRQVKMDYLDVEIASHPALLLLAGRVQSGSIHAGGIVTEGLRIEEVQSEYRNLVIKQANGTAKAVAGTNTHFQATFFEEDLNKYLRARVKELQNLNLAIEPDGVTLNVAVDLFNTEIKLRLNGNFTIANSRTIRFVLESLDVGKINLTNALLARVMQELEFDLEMKDFPLPLELKEIKLEEGRIRVLGGADYQQQQ